MENQNPYSPLGDSSTAPPAQGGVSSGVVSSGLQQIPVTEQNPLTQAAQTQPLEVSQNTLEAPSTTVMAEKSVSPLSDGDSLEQPTPESTSVGRPRQTDNISTENPLEVAPLRREDKRSSHRTSKALAIISGGALAIVLLVAGFSAYISRQNSTDLQSPTDAISEQDISIGKQTEDKLAVLGLEGDYRKLVVNGDVVTTGSLYIGSSDSEFYAQIGTSGLTANHTYTLPNDSGVICLDINNCNYLQEADVTTTTIAGASGALLLGDGLAIDNQTISVDVTATTINDLDGDVTLQGTVNQIAVSKSGNVITLTTPQDIATSSSPTFTGITLTGSDASLNGIAYSLPSLQGGGVLVNDGSGGLTWAAVAGACPTCFLDEGNSFGNTATLGTNDANDLAFETDGTTRMQINTDGHVGLGNLVGAAADDCSIALATCTAVININEAATDFSVDQVTGINNLLVLAASGNNSADVAGDRTTVALSDGYDYGTVRGNLVTLAHAGTGDIAFAEAAHFGISTLSSGGIAFAKGLQADVFHTGSGAILSATGGSLNAVNFGAGSIGTAYGLSVTTGAAAGSVTTNYGINVNSAVTGGTITNNYGIYIQDQSGAGSSNSYNLYSEGSGQNYFGGLIIADTLGAADNSTFLCRNSTDEIAACNTTGDGAAFIQGGNSFGDTATLGTNDAEDLVFETAGTQACVISGTDQTFYCSGSGLDSIRMGIASDSSGDYSMALGWQALSQGAASIAIGLDATAEFDDGIAIGNSANTDSAAEFGIAIGYGSYSGGIYSVALGYSPDAVGDSSIAIGNGSQADGNESIAIGSGSLATIDDSVAIGTNASAEGNASVALGSGATVDVGIDNAIAIGQGGAYGDRAIAIGYISEADGVESIAIGRNSFTAEGDRGIAIGRYATTSGGDDGIAIGPDARARDLEAVALGSSADAVGIGSLALGAYTSADYDTSIALGYAATTTAANQLVVGGSGNAITSAYFGNGVTNASPAAFTLNATGGSGTDIAGAALNIAGGRGTGSAVGGGLNFQTSAAGGAGASLNSLATVFGLAGGTGNATFQATADSSSAFRVLSSGGNDRFTVDTSDAVVGNLRTGATGTSAQFNIFGGNGDAVLSLDSGTGSGDEAKIEFTKSFTTTLRLNSSSGTHTIELPDEDGTLCIQNSANCGFATGSGSAFVNGGNSFGGTATIGTNDANSLAFETGGTTACSISSSDQSLSCPGAGASSERFGAGSTAGAVSSLALGNAARVDSGSDSAIAIGAGAQVTTAVGDRSTVIGAGATANTSDNIVLGYGSLVADNNEIVIGVSASAATNASNSIVIGNGATAGVSSSHSVAIGNAAAIGAGFDFSIALGSGATTTAVNQLVVGSTAAPITSAYFGNGVTAASPQGFTLNATGGSGTNIAGASLTLAGGRGTGSGNGGSINFQTSAAGASGSSLNSLSTVLSLAAGTGAATFQNATNSTTAFRILNATSTALFTANTSNNGKFNFTTIDGGNSSEATLTVVNSDTTGFSQSKGIVSRTAGSNSGNALEVQNSSSTATFYVNGHGFTDIIAPNGHNDGGNYVFNVENNDTTDGSQGYGVRIAAGASSYAIPLFIETRSGTDLLQMLGTGHTTWWGRDGADSTTAAWTFQNDDVTNGQSNGLLVKAGNNSTDESFEVQSRGGTSLFKIQGDGTTAASMADGSNSTSAMFTITNNDTTSGQGHGLQVTAGATVNDRVALFESLAGTDLLTVLGTGATTIQTATDSATGFKVMDADGGTSVLNVDTTNERVGIGVDAPTTNLDVVSTAADGSTVAQFTNAGATVCTVQPGGTGFACASDERLKSNVATVIDPLDTIRALRGVTFNWNSDPNGQAQVGFIAQELEQLIPSAVSTAPNGYKVANYQAIIPYLVGAAQEQDLRISNLQQSGNANTTDISSLSSRLSALEQQVANLQQAGSTTSHQGVSSGDEAGSIDLTKVDNLNVSGTAIVGKLKVTTAAIEGTLTVAGSATIGGNLTVGGHIIGNKDTRGVVTIPAGETEFEHTFETPYAAGSKPVVTLTATNTFAPNYRVESTENGFTVFFQSSAATDVKLNYQVQQ